MAMVTAVETRPGANPDRASFTTALKPRARSSPQPAASASPVPLTCPASGVLLIFRTADPYRIFTGKDGSSARKEQEFLA
jgi:hypothetical protein